MKSRSVVFGAGIASVFILALVARDRLQTTSASDAETVTWGASDPTWSPDGRKLAFSLFGSIWQVPSEGGPAKQVTVSGGYHAHPAWSPRGDSIVFVSGAAPAGRIPTISGKLMLVEIESGRERELTTPYPAAGTPAWSPDGSKVVCALRVPDAGALLYEVTPADGRVRQIQYRLQRGPVGTWADSAWSRGSNEIYFAARRIGAPQIWAMPSATLPIMIQLPLTKYRLEDIVLLHTLSAVPDGSGVIYSAVLVNGKGDYELYRVPRRGGLPMPITKTERDEFSPAVSPDGKLIAHVSNHLGNIDLFTMPISGGVKRHIQISGLEFRAQSAGRVRIRVKDEIGQQTPVRLFVRASDGKAYSPAGSPIFYYPLDPGGPREGFFVATGDDTFPAPAGKLQLTALKGIEYRILERAVDVVPGQPTEVVLQMERWTNWNERGWYTGENHFHANYNGSYYQKPRDSLRWLQAEDLNSANMIVANNEGAFIHDKEFFRGAVDSLSTNRYVLYWGQEYRNSDPLGHMAFLNIKRQVPPSYTSVIGSDSPYDFPLNTMAAQEARKQGGLVSYVHPIGGTTDVFDTNLGAKESPVTAALGAMDAIDILPFGEAAYQLWYRLLNCGFRILPGAGTDVFTNWRGINRIPGSAREYVEVGSAMNWDRWIERYREGRVFVTNGPLVDFRVESQKPGSEIRIPAGESRRLKLSTEISSRVPLRTVEFIRNGQVIESREVTMRDIPVRVETEVQVDSSCWLAVRITGQPTRGVPDGGTPRAHSSAVYVLVGAQPILVKEDIELMITWIDRLWSYLEERDNFGPAQNRERARKMFAQAREHYQSKLSLAR